MVFTNSFFYRRIDKSEKRKLDISGNIQSHNEAVCSNFENMISYDNGAENDDEFFRKLGKAVSKNELSSSPLEPVHIGYACVFSSIILLQTRQKCAGGLAPGKHF